MQSTTSLYAVHDENDLDYPGWEIRAEQIGHNPSHTGGTDYQGAKHTPIVRFQDSWGVEGSCIPLPEHYGAFALRMANFVRNSQGCSRWIVGNEANLPIEQVPGHPIYPSGYARCFVQCEKAIHALPGHERDEVIPGAIAPWNNRTAYPGNLLGDWVFYHRDMLESILALGGKVGGIALHTYVHGSDPALIRSDVRMGPPFQHRYYNFRVFEEFLHATPQALKHLPAYITETDQDGPWENANRGWVRAMYAYVNDWNQNPNHQTVYCAALYRWRGDKYEFYNKAKVIEDFWQAVGLGYTVPESPDPDPPTPDPPQPEPEPETWSIQVNIEVKALSSQGHTRRWVGELKEVL